MFQSEITTKTIIDLKLNQNYAIFFSLHRFIIGGGAGGVGACRTWPRSARLPLGAWLVLIGAKKMSPILWGVVFVQYLGQSSGGWGVESEISTVQPREREGSPGSSDADCQRKEGRCVAHWSDCSDKWSKNSAWYQAASRRAGILICSPDLSIGDFLETNAGFVWVEMAGVRVYSYYFSPNDPFDIFETQTLLRATLIVSRPSREKPAWTGGESWSVRWSLGIT